MAMMAKRLFSIIICAVVAFGCIFSIAGCGAKAESNTEQATAALEEMLNKLDSSMLTQYIDQLNTSALDTYCVDYTELIDPVFDNFSYKIVNATDESDGNVNVDVEVSSRQLVPAFTSAFQQVYTEALGNVLSGASAADSADFQQQLASRFVDLLNEEISSEEPVTTNVSVTMVDNNGTWEPDAISQAALMTALVGDLSGLQNQIASIIGNIG